jgi:predicted ATPase/class 3 adenylate cyclase
MIDLPGGTVTFLFTDIEGSTRLWEQHPEAMRQALARHDVVLRSTIETQGGYVFKTMGDQFCAAFATAPAALAAALAVPRALQAEAWEETGPLKVRLALHTGTAEQRDGDYFGPALNRVARLLAVGHGGQVLLSEATQSLVQDDLPPGASLKDLGSHRLRDLQRAEPIYQLLHPDLPADFPPLRSLGSFSHNLPQQVTSFIGREQEMTEIRHRLAATRLLTLTGAGGAGKTRLSLQVAADLVDSYRDGVWLVEFAPLADPALVPQALATVLSVQEEPGVPITQTLAQHLKPKHLLLLLDNCEHLLSACAQLTDALLRQCPEVTLLATSREGLGIAGETLYRVPSLSLPDPQHLPQAGDELLSSVTQYQAVRLFIDRAVAVQPGFAVTNSNAPAVAEVCHRLDGIPLAIELAAARVRVLPVEQIATRLNDRFRLLTGGSRTALPRQQTLRALIDWSYDLLTVPERTLLQRVSVFAGGWTLEAAEAVGSGNGIEEWEVLDLLTGLVDKSLVLYEERDGQGRYRLLETVRQYGRERLVESGEAETVRERHVVFFLHLAGAKAPDFVRIERGLTKEQADRLEVEHDNFRAALEWSDAAASLPERPSGDPALTLVRLATALGAFWILRGYWTEGYHWLMRAAEATAKPDNTQDDSERTKLRALTLLWCGRLTQYRGFWEQARLPLQEALSLFRRLGDGRGAAAALLELGWEPPGQLEVMEESLDHFRRLGDRAGVGLALDRLSVRSYDQRHYLRARQLAEEGTAVERELGRTVGLAYLLNCAGLAADGLGEMEQARAFFQQSLEIHQELGNKYGMAVGLANLGRTYRPERDLERARDMTSDGLTLARELGRRADIAHLLLNVGEIAAALGDPDAARHHLDEAWSIGHDLGDTDLILPSLLQLAAVAREEGDPHTTHRLLAEGLNVAREAQDDAGLARALEGFAALALTRQQAERAARLLGTAEAIRESSNSPRPPIAREEYENTVSTVRAALGEAAFAAAWAAGQAMSLEEAVECALAAGDLA